MCICIYVYMYIYICIYMYIYVYIYLYLFIYIYIFLKIFFHLFIYLSNNHTEYYLGPGQFICIPSYVDEELWDTLNLAFNLCFVPSLNRNGGTLIL